MIAIVVLHNDDAFATFLQKFVACTDLLFRRVRFARS